MRSRGAARGAAAVVVVVVLALVGVACTAPAPRGGYLLPDAPCADVTLVSLRGSSSPVASGETRSVHDRFRAAMAALAPGRTHRVLEVGDLDGDAVVDPGGYPAAGLDRIPGIDPAAEPGDYWVIGGYNDSRRHGGEELRAVLTALVASCPDSALVVAGTSMGADAAGWGLTGLGAEVTDRIASVQLFGDPRHVPGPWTRAPGADFPSGHGLLGPRTPYVPDALADRTSSWCGAFDGTCTGNVVLSVTQLFSFCGALRALPVCSTRHIDYQLWAHAPAMDEAVRAAVTGSGGARAAAAAQRPA